MASQDQSTYDQPQYTPATGYGTTSGGYNYVQTSPGGGAWSPIAQTPVPGGQVLGASTTSQEPAPAPNPNPEPSGPSAEDQLRSEVAAIFDPVFNELNAQGADVQGELTGAQESIGREHEFSQESLTSEKESSGVALTNQEKEAGGRKQDAWTDAVRLFNELSRGGQQRFGGASSAGEAFQSLTAVEQQRRQGTIQSAYEGAMQKVGQYKAELDRKYMLATKELELQKNEAMATAQTEFTRAMSQIRTNKAIAEGDKARATLETLQDLRNKVYAINMQNLQFAQQLAANKQQNLQYVDQFSQAALAQVTGGQSATSNMLSGAQLGTAYGANIPQSAQSSQQYLGQISPTKKNEEDS